MTRPWTRTRSGKIVHIPGEVDAVVFDCDGLLAETEAGWTRAETAIFGEHGYDFGPEQKQLLIGGTLASGGEAMADYFGRPGAGPELAARLARLVWQELAAGAPALPGARELAETLRNRGIPRPRRDSTVAHWVPGSTRTSSIPSRVSSATVVPSAAAVIGTRTVQCRSAPSRVNVSCGVSCTST